MNRLMRRAMRRKRMSLGLGDGGLVLWNENEDL
jgi:hypothetical protein